MLRFVLASLFLWALPALPAGKPASLQLCLTLPKGVALFSATAQPSMRQLDGSTWMLDFDLKLNGKTVERITKSGPDCLRAWVPAQHVKRLAFDFGRLPLNLADLEKPVDVRLEADRWSNAGKVAITRAPWASVVNKTSGTLTFERAGFVMGDPQQLPAGPFRLTFIPAPNSTACPVALQVVGSGTIRADRHQDVYRELVEIYRQQLVPSVIARHKLQCALGEAAQLSVRLDDGIFRTPLDPSITRVSIETGPLPLQLTFDGVARPFVNGMQVQVRPGQKLELADLSLHAAR